MPIASLLPAMVRPGSREGFTLLELMIVVVIVTLVAALAAPAIQSALSQRRAHEATLDLVRLARRARSESAAYGRAHLLRYTTLTGGGSSLGQVEMWRGVNNGCRTNEWDVITAPACLDTPNCVDQVDMSNDHYDTGSNHVEMRAPGMGGTLDVCYEPTGTMQWRTSAGTRFTDRNTAPDGTSLQGGVRFRFEPKDGSGANDGVVRWAVLPLGGDARIVR